MAGESTTISTVMKRTRNSFRRDTGLRCAPLRIVPLALLFTSACATIGRADDAPAAGAQLPYTTAQAEHGHALYLENCVVCHGSSLNDGQFGAPLKGSYFRGRWKDRTAAELFALTTATMPPSQPMLLPNEDYAAILAFIFERNGITAGEAEFPADIATLNGVRFSW